MPQSEADVGGEGRRGDRVAGRAAAVCLVFALASACLVFALSSALHPTRASAQEPSSAIDRVEVSVELRDCESVTFPVLRRLLSVELGPDVDLDPAEGPSTLVTITCEGDSAAIDLVDIVTGKHLSRVVTLAGPSSGRTRLIALAVTELLAASWAELQMRHEPDVEAEGADASDEERAVAREVAAARLLPTEPVDEPEPEPEPHRPLGVRAFGLARISGRPFHFSGGGGLGADYELADLIAISIDARVEQGSVGARDLGDVRATLAWGAVHAMVRARVGSDHVDFGAGVRAGAAILNGDPSLGVVGSEVTGAVLAPEIAFHWSLRLAYNAYLHLGADVAWVTVPVFGLGPMGEELIRIEGPMLTLTAGFEVRPDM